MKDGKKLPSIENIADKKPVTWDRHASCESHDAVFGLPVLVAGLVWLGMPCSWVGMVASQYKLVGVCLATV